MSVLLNNAVYMLNCDNVICNNYALCTFVVGDVLTYKHQSVSDSKDKTARDAELGSHDLSKQ